MKKAVAYYRTSSMSNVGEDKDSLKRQKFAVESYSQKHGYEIKAAKYDAGVTGDSVVGQRQGIVDLLEYCASDPECKTIIVENAGRFARNKDHAIRGLYALQDAGIESLIFADKDMDFIKEWSVNELNAIMPFLELVFAEKEKVDLTKKLREARERKKAEGRKKVEGRKSYAEKNPELVKAAKKLARCNDPKRRDRQKDTKQKLSLRKIATALYEQGFTNSNGAPLSPSAVREVLAQKVPA